MNASAPKGAWPICVAQSIYQVHEMIHRSINWLILAGLPTSFQLSFNLQLAAWGLVDFDILVPCSKHLLVVMLLEFQRICADDVSSFQASNKSDLQEWEKKYELLMVRLRLETPMNCPDFVEKGSERTVDLNIPCKKYRFPTWNLRWWLQTWVAWRKCIGLFEPWI